MPDWLIPVLTFLSGVFGGFLGASRKVGIIEVKLEELIEWRNSISNKIAEHNEDILVHDIEIQTLCAKSAVPRARRQLYRE